MNVEEYISTEKFSLFEDETLRNMACRAVEQFLQENKEVKRSQLTPIPSVIQAGSLPFLERLVKNQKEKNSKETNKNFWLFMENILSPTFTLDFSLYRAIEAMLAEEGLLEDEGASKEKVQQRQVRKANRERIKAVIKHCLPVYFEHFNCHYFYETRHGDLP